MLKEAAECWESGRLMSLLLKRGGPELRVTEDVILAAATNPETGHYMLDALFKERNGEITLTEKIMMALVGNIDFYSYSIFGDGAQPRLEALDSRKRQLYWQCRLWDELLHPDFRVTDELLEAAAGNRQGGGDLMKFFLERRGDDVRITQRVFTNMVQDEYHFRRLMDVLGKHSGLELEFPPEALEAVMRDGKLSMLEDVYMRFGEHLRITEGVLIAAAAREYLDAISMIGYLREHWPADFTLTESIIEAAAGNKRRGRDLMDLFLEHYGHQVTITERILKAFVGNDGHDYWLVERLINSRWDEFQITEEVVSAAVANRKSGEKILGMFLEKIYSLIGGPRFSAARMAAILERNRKSQRKSQAAVEKTRKRLAGISRRATREESEALAEEQKRLETLVEEEKALRQMKLLDDDDEPALLMISQALDKLDDYW